jgi:uncharacterized membrane protein YcjF (UPF0283 family)
MSEPLKPRIDFDGPLEAEKMEALKSARAFDGAEAAKFAPARVDALEEDEGRQKRWSNRFCGRNAVYGAAWSAPVWLFLASASWRRAYSGP